MYSFSLIIDNAKIGSLEQLLNGTGLSTSSIQTNPYPVISTICLFLQSQLYKSVINDVVNQVKEVFLDEGVELDVLQTLKQVGSSPVKAL